MVPSFGCPVFVPVAPAPEVPLPAMALVLNPLRLVEPPLALTSEEDGSEEERVTVVVVEAETSTRVRVTVKVDVDNRVVAEEIEEEAL